MAKVDVAVFNIYGAAAKDSKKAFGDTDAFVRWRVALMERTLEALKLNEAEQPIPDYDQRGTDQYQAIQIHDYESVSFFRQPAEIKAASSKIIETFQKYYPETVRGFHPHSRFVKTNFLLRYHSNTSSTFPSLCNG